MGLERGPKFFRDEQGATIVPAGPPVAPGFRRQLATSGCFGGVEQAGHHALRTHKQKLYRRIVGGSNDALVAEAGMLSV